MGIEHLLGSYYRQKNEFLTTDLLQNGQNNHDDCQQTHFCMVLPADKKSSTHCGEEGSILWPGKNHLFCVPEMSDLTLQQAAK
jgi:hypothetical protein